MPEDGHRPDNAGQLEEIIRQANAHRQPLEVIGTGTKRNFGNVMKPCIRLDLSRLAKVTLYEPQELVFSALAGMPRHEIEAELARHDQEFAFEPPDFSTLLGQPHAGTLGGMTAINISGPRRIKAGGLRDHLLGFHAVSGRGETFQSGGRVMKNVTGYDLSKLIAGSWGTLAAVTLLTFKVLPKPPAQTTLCVGNLDAPMANAVMNAAMRSACDVSGAAYLPAFANPARAGGSAVSMARAAGGMVCLRLEGVAPSVEARCGQLRTLAANSGSGIGGISRLKADESRKLWREIRDVIPLCHAPERAIWRISTPPGQGCSLLAALCADDDAYGYCDWAGGLIWLSTKAEGDGGTRMIRHALQATTGHATLLRAPEALRASQAVFQPQPPALAALSARLKQAFDPNGILNPQRLHAI